MTLQIVKSDFQGNEISFNDNGWFDATGAAAKFGKRPVDWLALASTKEYISDLKEVLAISEDSSLIKSKRNSGTWLHPKLAVAFARWLDGKFAIWCDTQIDSILREKADWKKLRHGAASSFKVMNEALKLVREEQGKMSESHHYSNEARLINYVVSGEFKSLERDSLTEQELNLMAKLEVKNCVLISRNVEYKTRKTILEQYAIDLRTDVKLLKAA